VAPNNTIDLDALSKDKKFALTIESETPQDAEAKRQEIVEEGRHRRRIQFWIIVLAIILLLASFLWCGSALIQGSADDKKLAAPIATAIVTSVCSGLMGFAIGQKAR
jgi:hypothetical protein